MPTLQEAVSDDSTSNSISIQLESLVEGQPSIADIYH